MQDNSSTKVLCPTCGASVDWISSQKFKPFCCERCKLIDLGEWIMEEKIIPGAPIYPSEQEYDN